MQTLHLVLWWAVFGILLGKILSILFIILTEPKK